MVIIILGCNASEAYGEEENRSKKSEIWALSTVQETSAEPSASVEELVLPGKRKRNKAAKPQEWKKNAQRILKQRGHQYLSTKGEIKPPTKVQTKDCSNCFRKCSEQVSNADQLIIHNTFWGLSNYQLQNQYIINSVSIEPTKFCQTKASTSRRVNTKNYFLTANSQKVHVCKGFFLATLSITDKRVRSSIKNRSQSNISAADGRGRHSTNRKRCDELQKDVIRAHIQSFPKVPSHYSRNTSTCEFLPHDLSLNIMYKNYVEYCEANAMPTEKLWLYREIFKKEFNLKFHQPRKD